MTAPMTAEELQAEIVEQCRLNAMGQEREAKLMAEVKALTATAKDYAAEAVQYRRERDEAKAQLAALRAKLAEAEKEILLLRADCDQKALCISAYSVSLREANPEMAFPSILARMQRNANPAIAAGKGE